MTATGRRRHIAIALIAWVAMAPALAGQETLARARDLYASAAYDEALVLLDRVRKSAPASEVNEIASYQVFCLLALRRTEDARRTIEGIVREDPLYRPSDSNASPRTRAVFEDVRRGLLPRIVQDLYERAKVAFDRRDPVVAIAEFDRVLALLDEPGVSSLQGMADLRILAGGFRDLSKRAAATAAVTTAEPKAAVPSPAISAAAPVYTADDVNVVPPVVVSRTTPPWRPRNAIEANREYRGVLELVIDERGDVTSVALRKSVHSAYDTALLRMARAWKFRPATKDGVPVRYRTTLEVRVSPTAW